MTEKMGRCIIFAAGPIEKTAHLPVSFSSDDYIIAADAGVRNTTLFGVRPNLVMGDMDSLSKEEVPEGSILFPVRKDDTDLMLAIKKGIELHYTEFLIYGALGGRLDHTFAAIQTLAYLLDHGCRGSLVDGGHWVSMLEVETLVLPRGYRHVSVFSYTEKAAGVTLRGLSYPLEDGELTQGFPLGVSNSYGDSDEATVSVREGRLLLILSDLP